MFDTINIARTTTKNTEPEKVQTPRNKFKEAETRFGRNQRRCGDPQGGGRRGISPPEAQKKRYASKKCHGKPATKKKK